MNVHCLLCFTCHSTQLVLVCLFPMDHGLMKTGSVNHSGISRASHRCYVFNQHLLNEGISLFFIQRLRLPLKVLLAPTPASLDPCPDPLLSVLCVCLLSHSLICPGKSQKVQDTLELQTHGLPAQSSYSCVAYRKFTLPLQVSVFFHL